ncbi:MAG: flavodoxin [Campylobacteraceae bacterium]|nr:flavodoxin [Campylobacteraceae bacterium]
MKTLVYYSSLTGNTRKVGEAIAKSLNADIKSIDESVNLDDYSKVIFGFYVDKGFMDKKTQSFAKDIKNKTLGIYFTLGAEPDGPHAKECMDKTKEYFRDLGNDIKASFCSQGAIDPKVIAQLRQMAAKMGDKAIHKITPEREARWKEAAKHPNEEDLKNAVKAFENF